MKRDETNLQVLTIQPNIWSCFKSIILWYWWQGASSAGRSFQLCGKCLVISKMICIKSKMRIYLLKTSSQVLLKGFSQVSFVSSQAGQEHEKLHQKYSVRFNVFEANMPAPHTLKKKKKPHQLLHIWVKSKNGENKHIHRVSAIIQQDQQPSWSYRGRNEAAFLSRGLACSLCSCPRSCCSATLPVRCS